MKKVATILLLSFASMAWAQSDTDDSSKSVTGRFRPLDIGYPPSLSKTHGLPTLWQLAKKHESQAKEDHFIGNTPAEWFTNVIPHDMGRTPDRNDAAQYYGHRISWADRIILGVGKQAQLHPRATRLIELISPGLSLDKPSHPRWKAK